ncbi:Uncharacterized protein BP5553_10231 [Venustampulla echinocandica]|uniref:Elongator complex protein 4 n=1 Tax=Venustampulla echinocandica TaxID=2656787 RepID=A0A370T9N0_9HELO|nr:Uncharacterized protein BP5553_10231 [Venustampulla echinocandica]RDL30353.1 Uncharacterized protein BP5553_10231 [Venustampulla echinocandica]
MSFRKRGVVVPQSGSTNSSSPPPGSANKPTQTQAPPGTRPSPLDGRLTTSTGTRSLDSLLAGHSGLALGNSLLIEESGTTDFGGTLLKYYVAEGVVQKHVVHVLGVPEGWGRELPGLGLDDDDGRRKKKAADEDKMKIAWRYERLGEFGAGVGGARDRNVPQVTSATTSAPVFCHDFDLSKRLILPSPSNMHFVTLSVQPNLSFKDPDTSVSPFTKFIQHLAAQLSNTPPTTIHRVAIPSLLSPALYPSYASNPSHILQFLHGLRALLRKYPTQLTTLITIPLSLHPRTTGLTRWIELLSDGVLELAPFPASAVVIKPSGAATEHEEPPQGMLKIHRLPIFHEKGGGGGENSGSGDDMAFNLSRRKGMVIKPYSLPPVEADGEAQQGGLEGDDGKKATKVDLEF